MDGTNPETTTADSTNATLTAGAALHQALCNLNIKCRPGVMALLALTDADWIFDGGAEADKMRCTVEWIATRLMAELADVAEELDTAARAAMELAA